MIGRSKQKKKRKAETSPAANIESDAETHPRPRDGRKRRGKMEGGNEKRKMVSSKKRKPSKSRVVARLVMSLSCHGCEEQLAWLEAYLRDEARDRTVDGKGGHMVRGGGYCSFVP